MGVSRVLRTGWRNKLGIIVNLILFFFLQQYQAYQQSKQIWNVLDDILCLFVIIIFVIYSFNISQIVFLRFVF